MSTEEKAENPESRVQGWVSRVKEGESPRSRVQSGLKRARGEIHWETHWNPLFIRGNEIQGYKCLGGDSHLVYRKGGAGWVVLYNKQIQQSTTHNGGNRARRAPARASGYAGEAKSARSAKAAQTRPRIRSSSALNSRSPLRTLKWLDDPDDTTSTTIRLYTLSGIAA